jgi:hypothetical protein
MRTWRTFGAFVTERYEALQALDYRPELVDQALLGSALLTAKVCLPKRKYIPWLRECTGLSQKTASRYIARWRKHLELKGWDPEKVEEDLRDLDQSLKRRAAADQEKG